MNEYGSEYSIPKCIIIKILLQRGGKARLRSTPATTCDQSWEHPWPGVQVDLRPPPKTGHNKSWGEVTLGCPGRPTTCVADLPRVAETGYESLSPLNSHDWSWTCCSLSTISLWKVKVAYFVNTTWRRVMNQSPSTCTLSRTGRRVSWSRFAADLWVDLYIEVMEVM